MTAPRSDRTRWVGSALTLALVGCGLDAAPSAAPAPAFLPRFAGPGAYDPAPPGATATPPRGGALPPQVEACADGVDTDRDGLTGCADPDCWGPACPEDCLGAGDEDSDGLGNCEDADCAGRCDEVCDDGAEGDGDGLVDCADPDCGLHVQCWADLRLASMGAATARVRSSGRSSAVSKRYERVRSLSFGSLWFSGAGVGPDGALAPCAVVAEGARWTATFQTSSNHTFGSTWIWGSGVAPGVLRPAEGACPLPTPDAIRALHLRAEPVLASSARAPGDALGVSLLGLRRGYADSGALIPTALELGPAHSARREVYSAFLTRTFSASQSAQVHAMEWR
jgi:hypothetical protein